MPRATRAHVRHTTWCAHECHIQHLSTPFGCQVSAEIPPELAFDHPGSTFLKKPVPDGSTVTYNIRVVHIKKGYGQASLPRCKPPPPPPARSARYCIKQRVSSGIYGRHTGFDCHGASAASLKKEDEEEEKRLNSIGSADSTDAQRVYKGKGKGFDLFV